MTYTQPSFLFVTISKQRIRSSARYIFRSTIGVRKERQGVKLYLAKQSGAATTSVHRLTLKVGGQRTSTIWTILKGLVAISTESAGKHTDIAEDTLKDCKTREKTK